MGGQPGLDLSCKWRFSAATDCGRKVRGYAYAAFRAMAEVSQARGDIAEADRLNDRAQKLRAAIEECFWLPDMGFYAVAIDGTGQACRVRASNAGHLLFCQVQTPEHAGQVIKQLLGRDFSSGWGIRTLASGQVRLNPMSYRRDRLHMAPRYRVVCRGDGQVRQTS